MGHVQLPAWVYLIVIGATLVGVAIGRFPGLRMNRATIALAGATLLIVLGAISLEQAYAAVDLNIILLLFAMMVVNVNLSLAGFFQLVTSWVVRRAASPRVLLALVIAAAGVLSALVLNDVVVLMFTPLVVQTALALKRNPIPYLVGLATAANIGSTATITGNPQNMLIGLSARIPYVVFTAYLAPVALVGLGAAWGVLVIVYRREFTPAPFAARTELPAHTYRPLLVNSLLTTGGMLIAFALGAPIPLAALAAAAVLLTTRRVKPARVLGELGWSLLIFFAGLFVVTGAIEATGFSAQLFALAKPLAERGVPVLAIVATILSNVVSNVPAVMLFRPLIPSFPDPQRAWLTLAMATTLAGNLTLLGSVANLIAAESAQAQGVRLSFREYLRAGVPITLLTLAVGIVWLSVAP